MRSGLQNFRPSPLSRKPCASKTSSAVRGCKPQIIALLDSFSQRPQPAGTPTSSEAPPNPTYAGETVPPTPPASEATSDACKHDEERLAELQAKPSLDEAVRLENEMECLKLQPQLLALLDKLIQAPQSAGAHSPNGVPSNTTSASEAVPRTSAPPTSDAASAREAQTPTEAPANTASVGEAAPPASNARSETSNDACKQDEDRLARLRQAPSSEEAPRFAQELRCETLRPELLGLTGELAKPPPTQAGSVSSEARGARNAVNDAQPPSQAIADAERRIAALENDKEALAAEVSRLQRNQVPPSAEQPVPPASPQPAPPRRTIRTSVCLTKQPRTRSDALPR